MEWDYGNWMEWNGIREALILAKGDTGEGEVSLGAFVLMEVTATGFSNVASGSCLPT